MFANDNSSDAKIISALKLGDEQAYRLIYDKYSRLLLNYGLSFTSEKELIKDCVHDLFLTIWRRRSSLDDVQSLQAYLLSSLRRLIIYHLNKQKKTGIREEKYATAENAEELLDDQLLKREQLSSQRNTLLEKIDGLPQRQREVIFLRFFAEMDYEEIGKAMDLNYQGVRNLVHKAITSLRGKMKPGSPDLPVLLLLCYFLEKM